MARVIKEQLEGEGKLYHGDEFICEVGYKVTVFVERELTAGGTFYETADIAGEVDGLGFGRYFDLMGEPLTLYLEDRGLCWDLLLESETTAIRRSGEGLYECSKGPG